MRKEVEQSICTVCSVSFYHRKMKYKGRPLCSKCTEQEHEAYMKAREAEYLHELNDTIIPSRTIHSDRWHERYTQ